MFTYKIIVYSFFILEPKELEGMKAVASEKVPEISRKDLMQIIKKSQYFQ